MFIVIVVQNLTQKEQQSTIFVKVAMVTTFTWKSEVSQCKSVEFMLSMLLFVSIDQENNLANFILKLQRRTLSLVNEQCKIIYIIAICY